METSLYLPVKGFLEKAGYVVKGEVGHCDLVGLSDGEPPVIVICELKLSFNLELILQAVDRAAVADEVWIAARVSAKGKGREADKRYRDLCRRLGIGMLGISDRRDVSVGSVSPMPRTNPKKALQADARTPAATRRSGNGRQHARACHDRLSPAGARLRARPGVGAAAGPGHPIQRT